MLLLRTEQEVEAARGALAHYRAQLAAIPAASTSVNEVARIQNMIAQIGRQIALWEADIREPVPGNPDRVPPPWTVEEVNAMSDGEYARASEHAALLLKQAEIANIDRQIGIALDHIADWRRHRAWLEREISELEVTVAVAS